MARTEPSTGVAPVRQPPAKKPFGLRFTLPLMLGTTLNPINSSLIATGLAGIAADFHRDPGTAALLVSVLYLCSAVMQPTMGKLATLFGPRRIFLTGVAILLIGGAVGGLAQDFSTLVVSRALIGVGTSACYPTAMAMVRRRADRLGIEVPTRVLGDFSIASQVTVVIGLPLSGVLAGAFGWRGLFWINVPLAAIALLSAAFSIEKDASIQHAGKAAIVARLDLPGIGLFAAAIVALLLFLGDLAHPVWWQLAIAAILVTALLLWERRPAAPLIDVRMLARNGALQRTYLRQVIVGLGVYTSLYATSQWMQDAGGYTAYQVGLLLLPMSAVSMVLARLASLKGWVRWPLVIGAIAIVAAGVLMLGIRQGSPAIALIAMSALFGVTNGLCNFANQSTLYAQSPGKTIAIAAGLFRTFGYIGAIFSSSLIGLTFGARTTDAGFRRLGIVAIAIGIGCALLTVLDRTIPISARSAQAESSSRDSRCAS